MIHNDTISLLTVPFFTGAIGYLTNWSGVLMLFYPVRFRGIRIPGLAPMSSVLPRKIQAIPGVLQGGLGWQGIIPSRAAKMGSISVDKGIAKLGSPSDFFRQLEPEVIAEHILESARGDMREVVDRIMEREHPKLWHDLPPRVREGVHARVQEQLPEIVKDVTDEIGDHVDQLLDIKLMVIRHIEESPELANRIFLEVGSRELKLIENMGFYLGFAMGIPTAIITVIVFPYWWLLPIAGVVIGYVTNFVALRIIFEPVEPRKIGRWEIQGLFLKRQPEVAEVYGEIISEDVVTLSNIGEELLHGPSSDRTRQMIENAMRPAVDRAVGRNAVGRGAVRVAVGTREYDAIRNSVAEEAVDYTMTPLSDPEFNKRQSEAVKKLITERMREMTPPDFSDLLRSAFKEDEWMLLLHGAVLGFVAGLIHLGIFG